MRICSEVRTILSVCCLFSLSSASLRWSKSAQKCCLLRSAIAPIWSTNFCGIVKIPNTMLQCLRDLLCRGQNDLVWNIHIKKCLWKLYAWQTNVRMDERHLRRAPTPSVSVGLSQLELCILSAAADMISEWDMGMKTGCTKEKVLKSQHTIWSWAPLSRSSTRQKHPKWLLTSNLANLQAEGWCRVLLVISLNDGAAPVSTGV